MKKVLSIVALMAFMVSSASVVDFKEKEKPKAKAKTEKACTDKKDAKACSTTAKKSCCSKK
ncbi:MAG: hypothetical protein V4666_04695 [Bacteroidota bacterium]